MKKSILTTMLLISGLLLCSCNDNPPSESQPGESVPTSETSENSENPSESESDRIYLGSWSESEQALIDEHVYGVNLPCVRIEGNTDLYYDSGYDCLRMYGAQISYDDLLTVLDYFLSYGWQDLVGDDYDYYGYYQLIHTVEVGDVTHYVVADIYAVDSDGNNATEGTYWLDVYDPYYYSWPTELVAEIASYYGSSATVPAYDDAYLYQAITVYLDWGFAVLYCYTDDTNAESVYMSTLISAGWTVSSEVDEYGYYVAYSPNNDLEVDFAYDSDYEDLDIYIYSYDGSGSSSDSESEGTGGEGTGSEGTDEDGNFVATLDLSTMTAQSAFTSQTVGQVTFSCALDEGSNQAVAYNTSSSGEMALRVYWGNVFTFSIASGYEIISVQLTRTSDEPSGKILDFDSLTWTNATASYADTICTATPTVGSSDVSFHVDGTSV